MLENIQSIISSITFYDYRYLFTMILGFLFLLLICIKILGLNTKDVLTVIIIGDILSYAYVYLINSIFGQHLKDEEIKFLTFNLTLIFAITLTFISIYISHTNKGGN